MEACGLSVSVVVILRNECKNRSCASHRIPIWYDADLYYCTCLNIKNYVWKPLQKKTKAQPFIYVTN